MAVRRRTPLHGPHGPAPHVVNHVLAQIVRERMAGPRGARLERSECGASGRVCPRSRPPGPSLRRRQVPGDRSARPRYPETPAARAPAPRRHGRNIRSRRASGRIASAAATGSAARPRSMPYSLQTQPTSLTRWTGTHRSSRHASHVEACFFGRTGRTSAGSRLTNLGRFLTMQQRGQLLDPILDPIHDGMTGVANSFCGI